MPNDFDGYRKWLGITSKKRLPTHYELLSISLDEDDPEVINAAAEQRRRFVESKRGDGHDGVVTEILYRISEAETTLLNNEMRRGYDRQLELFEKRQKSRQIDPNAPRSRIRSRPGATVGEGTGFVSTFAGILGVFCVAIAVMTWFSFQLPWFEKEEQVEPTPVAPVPITAPEQLAHANAAVQSQPTQAKLEDSTKAIASVPASNIAEDAQWTYLVTLPRIDLREYNGWWSDKGELILGGVGGQPINRKSLVFEGQHSVHGIYMHARPSGESFITFRLSGRFESFDTKAHIPEMLPNQGDPRTPLVFTVIGDGRKLWKSKPLSKKGNYESCGVSVRGINDLSLKIECPGPDNWALASWIEPHLLVAEKELIKGGPDSLQGRPKSSTPSESNTNKTHPPIPKLPDNPTSPYVGKYRLKLTTVRTRQRDPERIVEFRSDLTLITSDGVSGAWKLVGDQLQVEVSGFKTEQLKKTGKQFTGILIRQDGLQFRANLEKISD